MNVNDKKLTIEDMRKKYPDMHVTSLSFGIPGFIVHDRRTGDAQYFDEFGKKDENLRTTERTMERNLEKSEYRGSLMLI
ncbi:MAG: hypothetical protein PHU12_00700 [Candidatus Aenigmarchaeota archaeon]|nr:hypothetical protein [Candidatus Aenigmarchaeota archaeon]